MSTSISRLLGIAAAAIVLTSPVLADNTSTSGTGSSLGSAAPVGSESNVQSSVTDQQGVQDGMNNTADHGDTHSKLNVNSATTHDLAHIKGLSHTNARALVAYRNQHGNFNSVTDIAKVKGFTKMKATKLQQIEDQLTVN